MGAPLPARLWTVDALRGAAALGVVLTHAGSAIGAGTIESMIRGALSFGRDGVWLFFVALNLAVRRQRDPRAPSIAGSALAAVGLLSYSLYLTHEIVTSYGWSRIAAVFAGGPAVLLIAVATLASVLLARVFFLVFERPFLSSSSHTARAAVAV